MEDRKLLEAAAKVVGRAPPDFVRADGTWEYHAPQTPPWNPLADDGDALRLAVALDLSSLMSFSHDGQNGSKRRYFWTPNSGYDGGRSETTYEEYADDPCKATRRAIVRAAAAMATKDA